MTRIIQDFLLDCSRTIYIIILDVVRVGTAGVTWDFTLEIGAFPKLEKTVDQY